jgi:hypothetical protein
MENKEKLFRTYITDALKVIAKNTVSKNDDEYISIRWAELMEGEPTEKNDEEEAESVVTDITTKLFKFAGSEVIKE